MSGKIIELRHRRGFDRASFYRNQPVPRPAAKVRLDQQTARHAQLSEQVARILGLLCELEALTLENNDVPAALLARARASIDKTGSVLQVLKPAGNSTDDPQPNVDDSLLERMYRELDLSA